MAKFVENNKERGQIVKKIGLLPYFAFILILIASSYGGYLVFNELKQSQETTFYERVESVLQTLSQLSGYYIQSFDWPLLEELVQGTKIDPIIDSVRIEDRLSGNVFGENITDHQQTIKFYTREIIQDGETIGLISIAVDDTTLKQTISWLRNFLWFFIAAIVLLICGLAYLLFRSRIQTEAIQHAKEIQQEIDERLKAEENLKKLSSAVEQSPTSVVITDMNTLIEYVNPKFLEVTGYSKEEVIGQPTRMLKSGLTPKETYKELWGRLSEGKEWRGELLNRKKNGENYWEYISISPIRTVDGIISHYLAVKEDITLRKDYEARLVHQANYDSLTGLANRLLAQDRLDQAIKRARRDKTVIGILFIDLDHFKKVNDTLGHAAGDELLVETARRLKGCIREQDIIARIGDQNELVTIARLGGDEFIIILQNLRNPLDAEIVADRILKVCTKPYLLKGQELFMSASIGITIYPDDSENPEILMRNADAAMYLAKEEGRGTIRFFRSEINDIAQERLLLETELRQGFSRGELELYFQPLFNSVSNELEGAEALLRWRSLTRGLVSPDKFIPLAEDTGLIVPIGEWVLRTACEQAVNWLKHSEKPLYVSVNVSTQQFQQSKLTELVDKTLQETSLPPECLKLEVTESVLLQDTEKTKSTIQAIYDLGVQFSIDDFGTGYSSLSYLRIFPFETLKIDRSFVSNVASNESDANLVESIIAMAMNMNLKVVAEGIETAEQRDFIKSAGCDTLQGFGLGRPVPAMEFMEQLTANKGSMVPGLTSLTD